MSLLRVGGSHVGFEPTTYVVDDIWRDVLVGKLQFRVNTYRRASSNQFGRRMQRKDVMEETLCVRFGVVVIVETQVLPIGCQSNAVEVFVRPQNIDRVPGTIMALRMTAVNNSNPPGKGTGAARLVAGKSRLGLWLLRNNRLRLPSGGAIQFPGGSCTR
jgi:hypothetical protein